MKYYKITGDVGVPEKTFTLYESFNPTFDMDDVSYALACDQMKSWARDNNLSPTLEPHYSWVEITEEEYDLNTTRYIRFYGDAGYCGTEFEEYHLLRDITNDDELDDMAYGYALDNAAAYNWCVEDMGIDLDDDEEYEAAIEDAQNNLSYGWEEVTKEEYEAETLTEAHSLAIKKDEQMHEYHVVVTEVTRGTVLVAATSKEEAKRIAEQEYQNGDINLSCSGVSSDVNFEVVGSEGRSKDGDE